MSVWFGSGLVLSGFAMAVFGLVARVVVLSAEPWDRWSAYAGLWLVLLLVPAFVVNRIGARHHPAMLATAAEKEKTREATRALLTDQVRDEVRKGRWLVWSIVLISALLAGLAWTDTVRRFRGGMPDVFDTAYTAGVTLLLAGVLLFAVLLGPRGWPRIHHGGPVGALGAAAGALALLLVHGAVTVLPVDATTTEARDGFAEVPASVSGIGWTWEAPEGEYVREAAAAGAGLVVRIGDGVVAVDGETGEQLWHYRRPGATTRQLFAAMDGGTVLVTFQDVHGGTGPVARFVALDARTGRVRAEDVRRIGAYGEVRRMDLFDDGYVSYEGESGLVGLDPGSFAQTWRFQSPEECAVPGLDGWAGATDVVALVYECAEPDGQGSELVLVGLDPADGSEVWRYETGTSRTREEAEDYGYGVEVRTGVDGAAVALRWRTTEDDDHETVVLDQADGSVIADGVAEDLLWLERGSDTYGRQPNNPFGADGYVTSSQITESPVEFTWHPFDGGEPRRTAPVEIGEDRPYLHPGAALADLLVTTEPVSLTEGPSGELEARVVVRGAPWDGGEPWELGVGFEVHEHAGSLSWPDSTPLLRVPGALVVVQQGMTSVVGLV